MITGPAQGVELAGRPAREIWLKKPALRAKELRPLVIWRMP
jgi:hypothetical protein